MSFGPFRGLISPRTLTPRPRDLVLYQHPFASYCQRRLIALYELNLAFDSHLVEGARGPGGLLALADGRIPVLAREDADLRSPSRRRSSSTSMAWPRADHPGPARRRRGACRLACGTASPTSTSRRRSRRSSAGPARIRGPDDPEGVVEGAGACSTAPTTSQHAARSPAVDSRGGFHLADCATFPPLFYLEPSIAGTPMAPPTITALLPGRCLARPSIARVRGGGPPLPGPLPLTWPRTRTLGPPSRRARGQAIALACSPARAPAPPTARPLGPALRGLSRVRVRSRGSRGGGPVRAGVQQDVAGRTQLAAHHAISSG